ncbi:MAG: NHL repeat-containing protein [Planctomycetota bacterium]|jgi:outer membrane protein assembly factor BamB
MKKFLLGKMSCFVVLAVLVISGISTAVTSEISRHRSAGDLLKGETENTIIDSEGTIKLARKSAQIDLARVLKDVWIINTIVADSAGTIYLGTSPNGDIIKYSNGEATRIYPVVSKSSTETEPADPNAPGTDQTFVNEHIFAMAIDSAGCLLAAVSGDNCRLMRLENGYFETIYRPEGATYILAISLDELGNIYLGTGPEGKVFRLGPTGQNPQLVYDSRDKNILSLAVGRDDFIYAGSDKRGLVYKINPTTNTASVLYDSEQSEITSLLFDGDDNLYVAATSAEAVKSQLKFGSISAAAADGRPDTGSKPKNGDKKTGTTTVKIANTSKANGQGTGTSSPPAKRGAPSKTASRIYKINPQGFVTDIFDEMAVFFTLVLQDNKLLLGTGNNAQLFAVDPATEQKAVAYEDKEASQITAIAAVGDELYLGTSNPPKLIKLSKHFAPKGTFSSDLIDAGQPSMWGKLQIDADIPSQSRVLMSARSGNVKDPNDPTFSPWTNDVEVADATQLICPLGRFCQYRLTLKTTDPGRTPVIREVAVSHVIPNLPPRVLLVTAARGDKSKPGRFQITYKAEDDNKDTLIYKIEFRKLTRAGWIKLEEEFTKTKFEWDTRTIEDGRYEVRVTASDERSNTTATKLTGSRISDPFVVDNTAPVIKNSNLRINGSKVILNLEITDEFSAIGNVSYTVNSNEDWVSALPDDMVYDTTTEFFTIVIEDLEPGEHVIALKIADDIKNTMHKTFLVNVK